ncbi:hypothetical protein Bca52824_019933 [Brassica carinata]|uniref:Fe2OG dioxygenase domain-containing protein n=1 Tax=Brassica carinata TaxID=52824 RepID=A0A8X7VSY0_BRACI|nr:hypothetical protein Bca52824_019933 [Brassica carinata]
MEVERVQYTSPPSVTVPIIDLSDLDDDLVAHALGKASEEWGAFQVVNHGIPAELMRRLHEVGRQFFELPAAEKEAVAVLPGSKSLEGYGAKNPNLPKSWNDHLFHKIWPESCIDYSFWPKNPTDYREVTEEYARHVMKLTEKIMGYLSKGLGLGREVLKETLGGGEYMLRINYYPPSDSVIGAPAHTDFDALALLVSNGVPGLQVFKDSHWLDVEDINSAVVVILGDQIMRLSNGRYKSVLHRSTMDKEKTRMTWPVLIDPMPGMVVGPLPELIGDENPPKFESLTLEDYIYRRTNMLLGGG